MYENVVTCGLKNGTYSIEYHICTSSFSPFLNFYVDCEKGNEGVQENCTQMG